MRTAKTLLLHHYILSTTHLAMLKSHLTRFSVPLHLKPLPQIAALKAAGCELIFQEIATGGRWERPELHRLLGQLRKGDVVVVWKLDRLSRSLKDVLALMEKIQKTEAGFQSLTEAIETTSPAGRMMMQMVGAFAEFERAMLANVHVMA